MKYLFLIIGLLGFTAGFLTAHLEQQAHAMPKEQPQSERWWCEETTQTDVRRCRNKDMICYLDLKQNCMRHVELMDEE